MSILAPYVFLLLLTSVFSPNKVLVFGSPSPEQESFKRPDPLRGFKNYDGGYNVTNKHYLASAVFTGVHSYVIAGAWLLCGLGFGIFVTWKNLLRSDSSQVEEYLNHHFLLLFLLIILFTSLAIIAASLVLAANESSFYRSKKFKGTIVRVSKDTHRKIHKVIIVMTEMKHLLRPYDPATSRRLYTVTRLLAREARAIRSFVQKSGHDIDVAIRTSHILHFVVVTINLVFLVASLVLLLLHWHPGFITIIIVGWILTTMCWALTGFDFSFQNFVHDTCTAFQDFERDPQNSSLSSIVPCLDSSSSDELLIEIGSTIYKFITKLNWKMEALYMLLPLDRDFVDSVGAKRVCAPFSGPPNYTYIPETCSKDRMSIDDFSNRIYRLTCPPAPRPWRRSQRNSHCDGEEHHKSNRTFTRILIVVFTIISFSLTPSTPEKPVNFSNHGGHSNTHLTFR
ncbi:hypothetical protein MANES_12G114901v8 [Manihot esculenta]|uniref:Uncharacterized protein n=2 Tax=Manihot esculenta TaxID=3983 RepID=A0ACB7GRC1_MANES|nr:hypothetical protein MANES_12G114901v8 [Manihot esculenta]KAG8642733.1 hypothetical protein MANES_12G114901v8 [Manihot esculenta]